MRDRTYDLTTYNQINQKFDKALTVWQSFNSILVY